MPGPPDSALRTTPAVGITRKFGASNSAELPPASLGHGRRQSVRLPVGGTAGFRQDSFDYPKAVVKDARQLPAHKQLVCQPAQRAPRELIVDPVDHQCAAVLGREFVCMAP